MKDGIQNIIGKTIKSVIVTRNDRPPGNQVFLIFDDDTYFEFYGESFTGAGGIDQGSVDEVSRYIEKSGAEITDVY